MIIDEAAVFVADEGGHGWPMDWVARVRRAGGKKESLSAFSHKHRARRPCHYRYDGCEIRRSEGRTIMRTRTVPFLIAAIMIAGCSTVTQLEPQLVSEMLPFIRDGKTSKEEIPSRLGVPDHRYEGGKILTYKMCEDISPEGLLRLSNTRPTDEKGEVILGALNCSPEHTENLILLFGPDDLVERHSLVLVK